MKSYHTFEKISPELYDEIKDFIKSKHSIQVSGKTSPGLEESFDILYEFIKVHYYSKGKLLFQASPTNKTYAKLVSEIDTKFSLNSIDKIEYRQTKVPSDVKYFAGCDEAGAGETFGSIFLGCVVIESNNLDKVKQIFEIQNIKELGEREIIEKYYYLQNYCEIFQNSCDASEIDETSKNTLLDKKYQELLEEAISGKQNVCVIIDDYGIKRGLKSFFDNLNSKGNTIIVENKADEKYPACQAASVVARKKRFDELREINKNFSIKDKYGNKIYPGSGNASNPQTAKYLKAYMKKYPTSNLPDFVRRKWSNVRKLLQSKSNSKISGFFEE